MEQKSILIIEDSISILEDLDAYLSLEGYKTITASDGNDGISAALEHIPDMIICDINMPKMNGYEVLRYLKMNSLLKHIPLVFSTAKGQMSEMKFGLYEGAKDYLIKPYKLKRLSNCILKIFETL